MQTIKYALLAFTLYSSAQAMVDGFHKRIPAQNAIHKGCKVPIKPSQQKMQSKKSKKNRQQALTDIAIHPAIPLCAVILLAGIRLAMNDNPFITNSALDIPDKSRVNESYKECQLLCNSSKVSNKECKIVCKNI